MEAQELKERLTKILDQNEPKNCMDTMPEGLEEAFNSFIEDFGRKHASGAMVTVLAVKSIEPILSGTLCQGFWLGHDYALEHGQLRGD